MAFKLLDEVVKVECKSYSHPWSKGIFKDCLKSEYECWVMEKADKLIGHGVFSVAVGEAHLLNITVAPEYQGNGYGQYLLNYFLSRARDLSAEVMFLEVRSSNLSAIKLYKRIGFDEIGLRKNYYPAVDGREDALVMSYSLKQFTIGANT
ncbi:ribosomal protein S18-alanine N-acetyltransferase [Spartinivicinus ruber]|uniref:ribosomal protein S18-alanine N-acetyltransferase n=1 Tax=Spartinivicinus ruber TaxID=2683272 RepID=UPI0013D177FB|nr:ribosomal protein S18-alanine N-acetyltransferase [Spartinivicinus ruber]